MVREFYLLALSLAWGLLSLSGQAETLQEAWQLAEAANYRLRSASQQVQVAQFQVEAAEAAYLPRLGLEAGYTVLSVSPTMIAPLAALKIPSVALPVGPDHYARAGASVRLPIYTGGKLEATLMAAESSREAARYEHAKELLELRLQVGEAYTQILRTEQLLQVAREQTAAYRGHLADARELLGQGVVARNDLLAAQTTLSQAQQQEIETQNALELSWASYNRLLGRPLGQTDLLEPLSSQGQEPASPPLAATVFLRRPELAALQQQREALLHQAESQRADCRPQVEFSGGYSYQQNPYQLYPGFWTAGVGVRWELFDGGASQRRAEALETQAQATESLFQEASSLVELELRQSWLKLQEARHRQQVSQTASLQARENLRVVKERYRLGFGTGTEVLQALALDTQAQADACNANYDIVRAQLRLKRVTGEL